jgi:hypothetical protein
MRWAIQANILSENPSVHFVGRLSAICFTGKSLQVESEVVLAPAKDCMAAELLSLQCTSQALIQPSMSLSPAHESSQSLEKMVQSGLQEPSMYALASALYTAFVIALE